MTTARDRLQHFWSLWPTPEQSAQPWVKALEVEAKAELELELRTDPDAMKRHAADLEAEAERHDAEADSRVAGAQERYAKGNTHVADDWALMGRAARSCAYDARTEAEALRRRAAESEVKADLVGAIFDIARGFQ